MRILIADKLASEGAEYLGSQHDVQVSVQTGLAGDALADALRTHDGVVVRSAVQITRPVLQRCAQAGGSRLRAIARAGVGVDNIDVQTATRLGIAVMNAASASTIATAEHTFALMLALARDIATAHATVAGGGWDRNRFVGIQLHGKTLGVVGLGRIGRSVAERALAFGMSVCAYDPIINADSALEGRVPLVDSLEQLLARVDMVSFHVPMTEATTGMLDRAAFAAAKPGMLVINASRGGIVDEAALLEALESGQCGGAALDVFEQEPLPADNPLRNHPKILTTPHLGASTVEAQEAVAVDACRALVTYLRGEGMVGAVNAGELSLDLSDRQRAFVDLSARMIALLEAAAAPQQLRAVRFTVRGEVLASRADTIARYALVEVLGRHLDEPVNLINAGIIAEQRHIDAQTVIAADHGEDRLAIEIDQAGETRRVEGTIHADDLPRVTHLDGYAMDMVPAGHMVLLTNADEPGRIGLVGKMFGEANVNIAEMVIGRKNDASTGRTIAMMILKLDAPPSAALLDALRTAPGILSVASVELAGV
ncbi:MAG: phosphoglycerate dehydrogenase [Planctomycetes bacterium]|nr:phosphoglycerate dehydrogenase [Planctomycetota bacterium]